eukprot:SM000016S01880  [mRNA]  locus=s16:345407:347177:- [translate_table: standard]
MKPASNERAAGATGAAQPLTLLYGAWKTIHGKCIAAIPAAPLHPVEAVEKGRCASIARICAVHALDLSCGRKEDLEEHHERRLDGLALVNHSLATDVNATDALGIHSRLLQQPLYYSQAAHDETTERAQWV